MLGNKEITKATVHSLQMLANMGAWIYMDRTMNGFVRRNLWVVSMEEKIRKVVCNSLDTYTEG